MTHWAFPPCTNCPVGPVPGRDLFHHFVCARMPYEHTLYLYPRYIPFSCPSENCVLEESTEFNFLCECATLNVRLV